MITRLDIATKDLIKSDVKKKFNVDIDSDVIDFFQNLQSKVAVEEGFANKDTVRFFNLAVFKYNPRKVDSKNTMKRLRAKHNGDHAAAVKEFKEIGKGINIESKIARDTERATRATVFTRHHKVRSLDGKFTAR